MNWTNDQYREFLKKNKQLPARNAAMLTETGQKGGVFRKTGSNPSFALGRLKAGKMNKTERLYSEELERQKNAGEIKRWWFEAINLRIGENCFYKPDFLVMTKENVLELREVKGWMADDALVKIRAISEKYPFPLKVVKLVKGKWEIKEY